MRRIAFLHTGFAVAVIASVATTGCGDCISIGYPSATITAADAGTHGVVSLAGAMVSYTSNGRPPVTQTVGASAASNPFSICCATGALQLQVTLAGYAPVDTTIDIPSHGRCGVPELQGVVLQLRKTAS